MLPHWSPANITASLVTVPGPREMGEERRRDAEKKMDGGVIESRKTTSYIECFLI